jgi:hypothetical protein
VNRGVYFYLSNGQWQFSSSLPVEMQMKGGNKVTLEMNTDKPYRYHSEVIKRYPPGSAKNKGKGKK